MPFELIVYRPRGRTPVTIEEVDRITKDLSHFTKQEFDEERVQWRYKNADTGVHFVIKYDREKRRPDFPEWNSSPLTILIGLGKPSFFGYEAFPVMDRILKNLNLAALDPQRTDVRKQPAKLTVDQIRESWQKSNAAELEAAKSREKSLAVAPKDKLDMFWRYMNSRPTLQESLGPDVLVPAINMHRARDGSVKLSCIWPDATRAVIPHVDFVLVQREVKKLLSKRSVSGAVPYSKIEKLLRSRSEVCMQPVEYLLFNRQADDELLESLEALELESTSQYSKLSPDEVIEASR